MGAASLLGWTEWRLDTEQILIKEKKGRLASKITFGRVHHLVHILNSFHSVLFFSISLCTSISLCLSGS